MSQALAFANGWNLAITLMVYRVHLGDGDGPEIGAGWKRTGEKAGEYVSLVIDDPALAQPIVVAPAPAEGARRSGVDESLAQFGDSSRRRSATLLLQEYLGLYQTSKTPGSKIAACWRRSGGWRGCGRRASRSRA